MARVPRSSSWVPLPNQEMCSSNRQELVAKRVPGWVKDLVGHTRSPIALRLLVDSRRRTSSLAWMMLLRQRLSTILWLLGTHRIDTSDVSHTVLHCTFHVNHEFRPRQEFWLT